MSKGAAAASALSEWGKAGNDVTGQSIDTAVDTGLSWFSSLIPFGK